MNPKAVSQITRLLISGPMMVRQSKNLKNKYFKVALAAGGVAISIMALRDYLKDRELEKKQQINKEKIEAVKIIQLFNREEG